MDLIWENSNGATSVDAICQRAVVRKGSFYYFFKSKSQLAPDAKAKAKALFGSYLGMLAQARIQNNVDLVSEFKDVALDLLGANRVSARAA
jgi:AcrR family transcriptional regulator